MLSIWNYCDSYNYFSSWKLFSPSFSILFNQSSLHEQYTQSQGGAKARINLHAKRNLFIQILFYFLLLHCFAAVAASDAASLSLPHLQTHKQFHGLIQEPCVISVLIEYFNTILILSEKYKQRHLHVSSMYLGDVYYKHQSSTPTDLRSKPKSHRGPNEDYE